MSNLTATPNYSKRTFTIRTNGSKYRTSQFSKAEFEENLHNTGKDWLNFLRTEDFYKAIKL